jgi:galactokinase
MHSLNENYGLYLMRKTNTHREWIKNFNKKDYFLPMQKSGSISSPGRICLFGEHQDYLGLPVIPMAINIISQLSAY